MTGRAGDALARALSVAAGGPPPRSARWWLSALVALVAALSHLGTAAALAPALLAAVLAPLWLDRRARGVVALLLGVVTLPVPPGVADLGAALVVTAGALAAGALVAKVAVQVQLAQSAALRETGAHEEAVRAALARHEELTRRLDWVSSHDRLTGVRDRAAFLLDLDARLSAGQPTGVAVLALAGFAEVNEALGPDVGDAVLTALSRRLAHAARESDLVGRLGGDVFAVLLPGLTPEHAEVVGTRLRAVVDDPVTVGTHVVPLRSRAGIACAAPGELTSAELVRRAELTARAARAGGPVRTWEADSTPAGASRLELEADLHRGLLADEMVLLYQPLVSTATGRIASLEALVRWQHPERGTVPPDEFIGLAEASGLVVPLGLRVLEMACAQLASWSAAGSDVTVAVNVSARQLVESDVVVRFRHVLWSSGVDPRQVVLEITESLLVDDDEEAAAVLWQLRSLGVRLAIDDFGTGYSSLARLGELPVDELKVDKSFVDRLGAQPHDSSALVTAAVAMGHGLGLEVVAEGVETVEQAAFLSSVGCDLLQGYLLGRPQRAEDITPQLGRRLLPEAQAVPRQRSSEEAPAPVAAPSGVHVPAVMPSLPPSPPRRARG